MTAWWSPCLRKRVQNRAIFVLCLMIPKPGAASLHVCKDVPVTATWGSARATAWRLGLEVRELSEYEKEITIFCSPRTPLIYGPWAERGSHPRLCPHQPLCKETGPEHRVPPVDNTKSQVSPPPPQPPAATKPRPGKHGSQSLEKPERPLMGSGRSQDKHFSPKVHQIRGVQELAPRCKS